MTAPIVSTTPRAAGAVLDRVLALFPLVAVFVWALVAYATGAWLLKAPYVFTDELEIAQLARSIAETGHPALRGQPYWDHSIVPYLLAPAFLLHDTQSAYQLAKFTGVTFMTATIFPAYALARLVVSRPWALFAGAASIAIPSLMYAPLLLEEPFAYFFGTLGLYLVARALTLRTRRAHLLACLTVLLPYVRQELAMVPLVYVLAALALSWQTGVVSRVRRTWTRAQALRAAVLGIGVLIVLNEEMSHLSQTWQLSTRHYKHRLFDLGTSAVGALAIGVGVLPLVVALALLARPRGEPRTAAMAAFRAVLGSSLVAFAGYTALKATFLSTNYATRIQERNLIYLSPLLFVATAVWLERPRLRPAAVAAATAVVGVALWVVDIQLDWPYFEAPGFSLLALLNRDLSVSQGTLDALLLPLLALAVALIAAAKALERSPRAQRGLLVAIALLVVAWNGVGSWASAAASRAAAANTMANFPDPPNWIDRITGGAPTMYLGQTIKDATGAWLNEFWNRSIDYVWSLDATAPGPGLTVTPNLLRPDGMIASQQGRLQYVVADQGIGVVGTIVATPDFHLAGKPYNLFKIDYPLRLTHSITGLYGDGWSGAQPVAYNGFRTTDGKARTFDVVASRAGWGGVVPTTKVLVSVGKLVLGPDRGPKLGRVTSRASCTLRSRQTCTVRVVTPPPPFRIEVTVPTTFEPRELDPRQTDARDLGAQIGFREPDGGTP